MDENEYRFLLVDKNLHSAKTNKDLDFKNSLKAIVLGERIKTDIKEIAANNKNIEIFKIEWNCGTPSLI